MPIQIIASFRWKSFLTQLTLVDPLCMFENLLIFLSVLNLFYFLFCEFFKNSLNGPTSYFDYKRFVFVALRSNGHDFSVQSKIKNHKLSTS